MTCAIHILPFMQGSIKGVLSDNDLTQIESIEKALFDMSY